MLSRCKSAKTLCHALSMTFGTVARSPSQAAVMMGAAKGWALEKTRRRQRFKPGKSRVSEHVMTSLLTDKRCRFDSRELRDLRERWLAEHPAGKASKSELAVFIKSCLDIPGVGLAGVGADGNSGSGVVERLVDALDADGDGKIDFQEAVVGLSTFLRGCIEDKVRLLFIALDADGNGKVSRDELQHAFHEQIIHAHPDDRRSSIDGILASGDVDGDGELDLAEFLSLVKSTPNLQGQCSVAESVCTFNKNGASAATRKEALRALAHAQNLFTEDDSAGCADPLSPDVAKRVLSSPGLSPVAIGEFLACMDSESFFEDCARKFFQGLDLSEKSLDVALRCVSTRLCFPREAQQIDRLVFAFSEVYATSNPGVLTVDQGYLVSFAIVMLNADLHSKNVKKKMSQEAFVRNVPGVDHRTLEGIYNRVKVEEIKLGVTEELCGMDVKNSPGLALKLGELAGMQLSTTLGGLVGNRYAHECAF